MLKSTIVDVIENGKLVRTARLEGRLTYDESEEIKSFGAKAEADHVSTFVLDAGGVTHVNTGGLNALVNLRYTFLRLKIIFSLVNRSARLEEVLSITRLTSIFDNPEFAKRTS